MVPARSARQRNVRPSAIGFESKTPAAVAVCGNGSRLVQTTTSPRLTLSVAGANCTACMTTSCVVPARSAATATTPSVAIASAAAAARTRRRPGREASALLAKLRLHHLRVLEVGDERRPHRDEQVLQLRVLRARDQRLVERIDHLFVVRDLLLDVGAVERRAAQRLQVLDVVLAALLQALAGRVVLGGDLELGDERHRLLVDAAVVGDHLLAERLDVGIAALRLGELAG